MKRRLIAFLMCVFMVCGVFCGCSDEPKVNEEVKGIVGNMSTWSASAKQGTSIYLYAVTDLDQNGKYEMISAENFGTGNFTESRIFELGEDKKTLREIEHVFEGESQVDLMQDTADVYKEPETGRLYYIFSDNIRNGYKENYNTKVAISLYDDKFTEERLITEAVVYEEGSLEPTTTYYNSKGEEVTKEDYDNAVANRFAGYEKLSATFCWKGYTFSNHDSTINADNDNLGSIFTDSMNKFSVK